MNEVHQLASAVLAAAFAAAMLVAGQLFVEYISAKHPLAAPLPIARISG